LIVPNTNIIIASQIYPGKYASVKHGITATTLSEYYEQIQTTAIKKDISWLGFPSMVFSYNNRNTIKEKIRSTFEDYMSTCVSFLFGPFSFHTTEVISDIGKKEIESQSFLTAQDKHRKFRELTKEVDIHGMVPWERELLSKTPISPLTTIEEARDCMINEQSAMDILQTFACHGGEPTKGFIRYNEVWSFFYPWDICGIETGLIPTEMCMDLLSQLNKAKDTFLSDLAKITIDESIVDQINADGHIDMRLNENPSQFIFIKFVKECFPKKMNQSLNVERSIEYLIQLQTILIETLTTIEYRLYDYSMDETGYHSLKELTTRSPFQLFEQHNDTTYSKISYCFLSTNQLQ